MTWFEFRSKNCSFIWRVHTDFCIAFTCPIKIVNIDKMSNGAVAQVAMGKNGWIFSKKCLRCSENVVDGSVRVTCG